MNETTFGIIPIRRIEGKNMFLLVKSRQGNWGFPKGHPKENEAPLETAERELREETGITDVSILPESFSEARVHIEAEYTVTKVVIWFLGVVDASVNVHIRDKNEIVDHKWLRFDEAYDLLSHDETRRVFLDVRIHLDTIFAKEKFKI